MQWIIFFPIVCKLAMFVFYFFHRNLTSFLKLNTYLVVLQKSYQWLIQKKVWIDSFPEPTSLQLVIFVAQLSWEVYSKSVCVDCTGTELEESRPLNWVNTLHSQYRKEGRQVDTVYRESPHYRQPRLGPTASKNEPRPGRRKSRLKLAVWGRTSLAWGCTEKAEQ